MGPEVIVMRLALLLGLIFQTFMINYAAAQSTATDRTVPGISSTTMGMNGWTIAGTYNVTNYFGATAEFSGQYAGDFLGVNASFTDRPVSYARA